MLLAITNFNVVISVVGGWLVLVGVFSHLLSDAFYLSEAFVSLLGGVTFTHVAQLFKPVDYVVSEDAIASVTLDFSRLVLGIQLVLEGIRLPKRYLRTEWKSLALLLGPGMLGMWACSSAVIWLLVPGLPLLHALAVAACITPTDPVLSSTIVKGKWADENVPEELQRIIVAESGANDGLGYPFLFIALYLIKYAAAEPGADGGALRALELFFGQTCVYVVLMSVLYGAVVGLLAQKLLAWAERHKYVDRESFLLFPIGLAIFVIGTCGTLGSDDVLACFVAGNAFTWNDWFRIKTLDDPLQPSMEVLLNLAIFMWFGAVCPWESFWSSDLIHPVRLFALGALVLLLRRVPTILSLHPYIRQIQGRQQALFVGYFGPIGVSAIFYLYVGLEFLDTVSSDDGQREDAKQLGDTMMVVIWFLVICSIKLDNVQYLLALLPSPAEEGLLQVVFSNCRSIMLFFTLLAVASAALVGASPSRLTPRAATCTPKAGGSSSTDDVAAIQSAIAACPSGTIVIPASTTYYVNSVLSLAGCKGCTLQVEGLIKVSSDTTYWNGKTAVFLAQNIDGLTVTSTTGSGVFDGNEQASWDKFASDSSYARPTLFYITGSKNIKVSNLSFKNAPNVFHSVTGGSSNVAYTDITLSAMSKSSNQPKNTDGWDIGSSSYVTINGATVTNDDDCVAFKPGADHVEIYNISCTGSHGISVGSLGSKAGRTDTVSNVVVSGAKMSTSTKAAGIKLYAGGPSYGTAVVSNVTFKDFTVASSDYAFQVQSCYNSDASYCASNPSTAKLSGVVVSGFSGTTSTKYAPVVANINCPKAGSCGIAMSGMTVKAGSGTATYQCANTASNLGVTCSSGASG